MCGIFHQRTFCQLDLKPLRRNIVFFEGLTDVGNQAAAGNLLPGDVDRDLKRAQSGALPARNLGADAVDHPVADFTDQAEAFQYGDKYGRRNAWMTRAWPAQQRLKSADTVVVQVQLGLVDDFEGLVAHRFAQRGLKVQTGRNVGVHLRRIEPVVVRADLSSAVHGGVGMSDQFARVFAILRVQGNADAGGHDQALAFYAEGRSQCVADAFERLPGIRLAGTKHQNQGELIAVHAAEGVAGIQAVRQSAADFQQHLIAQHMPPGFVDVLETVDIDRQCRQLPATDGRLGHAHLQAGKKQIPVGQAGQRVVVGHGQQALVAFLAPGDVAHDADDDPVLAGSVGLAMDFDLDIPAALVANLGFQRFAGAFAGDDLVIHDLKLLHGRLAQFRRRLVRQLLGGVAQQLAGPAVEFDQAHGVAVDQEDRVFGGVHYRAKTLEIDGALLQLIFEDQAVALQVVAERLETQQVTHAQPQFGAVHRLVEVFLGPRFQP